jgi:alpha-L-rhamnosidase
VTSAWEQRQDRFKLIVEVPANTRATVRLPKAQLEKVTESGKPLVIGDGIVSLRQDRDAVVAEICSGQYVFAYPWQAQ